MIFVLFVLILLLIGIGTEEFIISEKVFLATISGKARIIYTAVKCPRVCQQNHRSDNSNAAWISLVYWGMLWVKLLFSCPR